ncbi:MAG: metalloregulator ArsR/SmtB family transcription factor [Bacillota bacterium]
MAGQETVAWDLEAGYGTNPWDLAAEVTAGPGPADGSGLAVPGEDPGAGPEERSRPATGERPPAAAEAPVCGVDFVHEDVVDRLRPELDRVAGLSEVFKALADETRLKVIYALSRAELCVCDVAALIGGSKAAASYHLRLLYRLGLARCRREGKMVYYRLADPRLGAILGAAVAETPSGEPAADPPGGGRVRKGG